MDVQYLYRRMFFDGKNLRQLMTYTGTALIMV